MMNEAGRQTPAPPPGRWKAVCRACSGLGCGLVLLVILFLAMAAAKVKYPSTTVVSVAVEDITVRTRPSLQFNFTLYSQLAVHNTNFCASFRHKQGWSILFFRGLEIGEAEILPGLIHVGRSRTFRTRITITEPDRLAADKAFVADASSGAVRLESLTTIPWRVTILGIFHRHTVTSTVYHVVIGVSDGKVQGQKCSFDMNL